MVKYVYIIFYIHICRLSEDEVMVLHWLIGVVGPYSTHEQFTAARKTKNLGENSTSK